MVSKVNDIDRKPCVVLCLCGALRRTTLVEISFGYLCGNRPWPICPQHFRPNNRGPRIVRVRYSNCINPGSSPFGSLLRPMYARASINFQLSLHATLYCVGHIVIKKMRHLPTTIGRCAVQSFGHRVCYAMSTGLRLKRLSSRPRLEPNSCRLGDQRMQLKQ